MLLQFVLRESYVTDAFTFTQQQRAVSKAPSSSEIRPTCSLRRPLRPMTSDAGVLRSMDVPRLFDNNRQRSRSFVCALKGTGNILGVRTPRSSGTGGRSSSELAKPSSLPTINPMAAHPELYPEMRDTLIDWLRGVAVEHSISQEVVADAVFFIDRYLTLTTECKHEEYQLLGIACLRLRLTSHNDVSFTPQQAVYFTDNAYTCGRPPSRPQSQHHHPAGSLSPCSVLPCLSPSLTLLVSQYISLLPSHRPSPHAAASASSIRRRKRSPRRSCSRC